MIFWRGHIGWNYVLNRQVLLCFCFPFTTYNVNVQYD